MPLFTKNDLVHPTTGLTFFSAYRVQGVNPNLSALLKETYYNLDGKDGNPEPIVYKESQLTKCPESTTYCNCIIQRKP